MYKRMQYRYSACVGLLPIKGHAEVLLLWPAALICIGMCLAFESVTACVILGLRSVLGYLFVDDANVVHLVCKVA